MKNISPILNTSQFIIFLFITYLYIYIYLPKQKKPIILSQMNHTSVQQIPQYKPSQQKPRTHKLISFQQQEQQISQQHIQDIIQDLNIDMNQQNIPSLISQGQKSRIQRRKKVNAYLNDRKTLGLISNKRLGCIDEQQQIDGALLDELVQIQNNQKVNSQKQYFILTFNKKPDIAINQYIKKGIIKNNTPQSIAQYLIDIDGLDKQLLGEYFGKNNQNVLKVLYEYCKLLKFKNVQFDKAIRQLLSCFRLPGQSQQIQRIIEYFSLAYYEANNQLYQNSDQLFPLAYAIIMLATDAHNPKQQKKMTKQAFIKNTQGPCPSITAEYLSGIYDRITKQKFQIQVSNIENIYVGLKGISADFHQILKLTNQLKKGDIFLKICKSTKKFVQRKIYLSNDEQRIQWLCDPQTSQTQKPRFIQIKDISDLTIGLGSQVMKKNKVPQEFESLCFTITTYYRTLDLKAKTYKQRAKWINYIRAILVRRRQNKIKQLEQEYKTNISRQQIQQIWNTQIFPHWDQHWDYKRKKPKQKNVIVRGFQRVFSCMKKTNNQQNHTNQLQSQGQNINIKNIKIKSTLLQTLWKLGLPQSSRKILWPLIIGNNLVLNQTMIEQIKKRINFNTNTNLNMNTNMQLKKFTSFNPQIIQLSQICRQFRPDIPPVRDLLKISQIFWKVIPKNTNPIYSLLNLLHIYHFLAFYRADKFQIDTRIKLFQYLLTINASKVKEHFEGLKLEIKMFLVSWFLSIFYDCFNENQEFLFRIWDNFLMEGQIYLFKVGITLIKYFQIQLQMCTFHQGLKLLRFPKGVSPILFFKILEQNIDVKQDHFMDYVQKRKNAVIKTKVQAIPLEQ